MSKQFIPYILEILEFKAANPKIDLNTHINIGTSSEEDFLGKLFDIIRILLKSDVKDKDSETLLKVLPACIQFLLKSDDFAFISHASACIKSYVMVYGPAINKM